MSKKKRYVVLYDGYCLLCGRAKKFIEFFDWFHAIETMNLYDAHTMAGYAISIPEQKELLKEVHLIDTRGNTYTGFYACRKIGVLLPITFIPSLFLYIPGVSYLGERIYKFISQNRV